MKTTLTATYRTLQSQISRSTAKMQQYQETAASGIKLNTSSDDPSAVAPVINAQSQIRSGERFQSTVVAATNYLDNQDSTLDQLENLMVQAKELVLAAGNGSLGDGEIAAYGQQMTSLREEAFALANTQVEGKYLFAGFKTDTQPFPDPMDPTDYQGDGNHTELQIGPGQKVVTNLTGAELFGGSDGGLNILALLSDLEQNLGALDTQQALTRLDDLETGADQVRGYRSKMGTTAVRVEEAGVRMQEFTDSMEVKLSGYRDADIIEAYSDLAQQEQALQAALSVTAKISQLSILDYL
ncbi:flagellar hook-filament junction protein FlgL [Syntrophotalea carbinolica DSM 2380]|uniref:Flagellar hook-filament junction protein FlgL n=1 Tax=Syntrophotalea carbinolica (strain DSM 2380 / NBRC 103641 / GraBd1) TaxID=338963 RepID=Q3A5G0_SYNC1|nr:flagellar hook-associated protein FlgL [Syntrophotalea carbinolica]ABA88397.1 flagellar hook-filament junction protein FlgL [Syntrophotalea carbinolica DSM 2380]